MVHVKSDPRAAPPWGHSEPGMRGYRQDQALSQDVAYLCEKGCAFSVPLAADAKPPTGWDCRCGGTARLEGLPEDAAVEAPRYGLAEVHRKGTREPYHTHLEYVRERRSETQAKRILEDRLREIRAAEAAR